MIKVETKFVSSLTELERTFSVPLLAIGQALAPTILQRITEGVGAAGPLSAYGDHSPENGTRFWVPPGMTQPDGKGLLFRVPAGNEKWGGFAVYETYKAYAKLVFGKRPRTLYRTGAFLRSVAVRVLSPTRVKIAPYGIHPQSAWEQRRNQPRRPNTNVGYLASRFERQPLFTPSPEEIRAVGELLKDRVVQQALEAARVANVGVQARRSAVSAQRRASRLLGDIGGRAR